MRFWKLLPIVMEAVGYGHKAGSPQPPDPRFVLFNSPLRSGGAVSPARGSLPLPGLFRTGLFAGQTGLPPPEPPGSARARL